MAINKVIDRNNNTLLDLTMDTVAPNKVLSGVTFHKPDGTVATGMLEKSDIDMLNYKFIDYDGTLLYSYTDEELDALTELPAGVDHTDENLTFEGWNWDLDELKNWDRTRLDRPVIGAHYITTDGKTYFYIQTNSTVSIPLKFYVSTGSTKIYVEFQIDWGDGSDPETFSKSGATSVDLSHTFNPGSYTIVYTHISGDLNHISLGNENNFSSPAYPYKIKGCKIGNFTTFKRYFLNRSGIEKINIPKDFASSQYSSYLSPFQNTCIKFLTLGKKMFNTTNQTFDLGQAVDLEGISFPNKTDDNKMISLSLTHSKLKYFVLTEAVKLSSFSQGFCEKPLYIFSDTEITSANLYQTNVKGVYWYAPNNLPNNAFYSNKFLENIFLPEGLTKIGYSAFDGCVRVKEIVLPSTITSIGSSAFSGINERCIIDISKIKNVINITSSLGFTSNNIIKVPNELLDQYKSAAYWSQYADYMIGV